MLSFVGLGLYDERSITIRGTDAIRDADRVFIEEYTSTLAGSSIDRLRAFHDVEIEVRDRSGVEEDPGPILSAAETGDAVFLAGGDAMISTTHVDLRLRAERSGIETRVVHGTTAQSAASGLTGLQNYRFGKATTLPFPDSHGGSGVPDSVLETIEENRSRGLHTLVYLDIKVGRSAYMTADRGAALLETYEDQLSVAIARAGSSNPIIVADRLSALAEQDFGSPLHLLILPGDLHPMEADALGEFGGAPEELLEED